MVTTEHTPGPWEANEFGLIYALPQDGGDASVLVADVVADSDQERPTPDQAANGRLIAAAPDLLAAVEGLTKWAAHLGGWEATVWDQARAALAKARGEPLPTGQVCDDCGTAVEEVIGCPDGVEVCQDCFDGGQH